MKTSSRTTFLAAATISLLAACAWQPAERDTSAPAAHPLTATLDAHGGLDAWQRHSSLTYRMVGFPLTPQVAEPSTSRVDLRTRRNRIDADGYELGFDGERAWVTPGPEAVGLPPRFYALGSFYFIGMPFVFADEGAVVRQVEDFELDGKRFEQFQVGYTDGVGHSDDDHYVLLVEPDTRRLAWIHHTVTETNGESGARVAWRFDRWQTVGGVELPAAMTFFPWQADAPQGDGAPFTIDRMEISERPFDDAIYAAPLAD